MSDEEPEEFDVSLLSYEEFIPFFFDRPIFPLEADFCGRICPGGTVLKLSNPAQALDNLTRMCLGFHSLGNRFSLAQINQGIWAILSRGQFDLSECLWDAALPVAARRACVRAMRVPYSDFVASHPAEVMENCFYMWWDLISYTKGPGGRDGLLIRDAIFETLCDILALEDSRCQNYALHGLGHSGHPEAAQIIQQYIDAHKADYSPEGLAWLEECRDGTVM